MKKLLFLIFIFSFSVLLFSQNKDNWLTYYEKSNYLETPNYDLTIDFCKKLEKASPYVKYFTFGKSYEDRDLPALLISKSRSFTPELQKKSKKALVMIQCGIHAGEIDGKDAMLLLVRDIVIYKKYQNLLDNVDILIIPIFNVDGHERISPYNRINQNGPKEMGWRVNALNLNLNRDYLKADALEMKYWLKLFNSWMPDFFVDCHVSDGADWPYTAMYEVEKNQNINKEIASWTKEKLLPYVLSTCEKNGHPLIPYIGFIDEFDITKGISSGIMPPRLSTGYTAIRNRQGFLIETHSYKNYKTRVDATYQICKAILEILNKEYKTIKELNKKADEELEKCYYNIQSFPISFKNNNNYIPFTFYSFKMITEKSVISGTTRRYYDTSVLEKHEIPYYNSVDPIISVKPPYGYIIPKQWSSLVEILKLHNVKVLNFEKDQRLNVTGYRLSEPRWQEKSYEGRHFVSYKSEMFSNDTLIKKGSYFVPINQQSAKVIMYLLEPVSNESFVSWGFMDAIFEQKEYAERYVLEKYALQLYNDDKELRKEFDNLVKNDSSFASNPFKRLNFFYQKLPYYDKYIGVYPILRIENEFKLIN